MLEQRDLEMLKGVMESVVHESGNKIIAEMDTRFRESENMILEELDRVQINLEKRIDKVQKNLDELNQYAEEQEQKQPEKVYMEGYEVKGRIQIPKTGIDYPVLETVTKNVLLFCFGFALSKVCSFIFWCMVISSSVSYPPNISITIFS